MLIVRCHRFNHWRFKIPVLRLSKAANGGVDGEFGCFWIFLVTGGSIRRCSTSQCCRHALGVHGGVASFNLVVGL